MINEKREWEVSRTGPGLWVSVKVVQGDMTSMQEGSKSHLVVGRPTIAELYSAELSRLSKAADRNVEVLVKLMFASQQELLTVQMINSLPMGQLTEVFAREFRLVQTPLKDR